MRFLPASFTSFSGAFAHSNQCIHARTLLSHASKLLSGLGESQTQAKIVFTLPFPAVLNSKKRFAAGSSLRVHEAFLPLSDAALRCPCIGDSCILQRHRDARCGISILPGIPAESVVMACVESCHIRVSAVRQRILKNPADVAIRRRHMRQWYKLQKSYQMMKMYEQEHGRQFDLVLKMRTGLVFCAPTVVCCSSSMHATASLLAESSTSGCRTDMTITKPIDLADYPDVLTSRHSS